MATAADPGPTVLEAASAGLTATGSTSALPQTGSGLPAVVGPTDPGSALVVWIVLAVVAIPGTMVMALIALVLVRR